MVDARTRRAGDIEDLGELRRLATLAAFATLSEQAAQDEVLDHVHTVFDDIEHRAQASAAGAEILVPPTVMPWGAHMYLARDLEGYVWCSSTCGPERSRSRQA